MNSPCEEKMPRLVAERHDQVAEFAKREQAIKANLRRWVMADRTAHQLRVRNAEGRRTQSLYSQIFSALSAPLRLKFSLSAKREQAIKTNLRRLGYGE